MNKLFLSVFFICWVSLLSVSYGAAGEVKYGENIKAAHYHNVGDATLYYETYGQGQPLLLLHGGWDGHLLQSRRH